MNWLTRLLRRNVSRARLLHRSELQEVLAKERLRCDRNGSRFCFVTFELRAAELAAQQIAKLADVFCDRLRRTDAFGQVQADVLGVVLPDTPVAGAWKVVDDIIRLLPLEFDPPFCSVYAYPTPPEVTLPAREEQVVGPAEREAKPLELLLAQRLPSWKRAMDVAGASLGLLLLAPVFCVTALAVRLTSPGPILFRQARTGLGGRRFEILKFRTMRDGAHAEQAALRSRSEQDGPAFKLGNDPRMTRVGKFLRRTSIDELPQLWNVLRGEMSLVGPRPLPCEESDACLPWQKQRLDVTPGLTCIWQVSARSQVRFVDWMRLDLRYARRRCLTHDLWLVFQTVRVVFVGTGK